MNVRWHCEGFVLAFNDSPGINALCSKWGTRTYMIMCSKTKNRYVPNIDVMVPKYIFHVS